MPISTDIHSSEHTGVTMAPKNHESFTSTSGLYATNDSEVDTSPMGTPDLRAFNRSSTTADVNALRQHARQNHHPRPRSSFDPSHANLQETMAQPRPNLHAAHSTTTHRSPANDPNTRMQYLEQQWTPASTTEQNGQANMVNQPRYTVQQYGNHINNSSIIINTQARQYTSTRLHPHPSQNAASHAPSYPPRGVQMSDQIHFRRQGEYDYYLDGMSNVVDQIPIDYGLNYQHPATASTPPCPPVFQAEHGQAGAIHLGNRSGMGSSPQQTDPMHTGKGDFRQEVFQMRGRKMSQVTPAAEERQRAQAKRRRHSPNEEPNNAILQQHGTAPSGLQSFNPTIYQRSSSTSTTDGYAFSRNTLKVTSLHQAEVNATLRAPLTLSEPDDWQETLDEQNTAILEVLEAFDVEWSTAPTHLSPKAQQKWNNSQKSQLVSLTKLMNKNTTHPDHGESAARVLFHAILDAHTKGGPRRIAALTPNTKLKFSERVIEVINVIERFCAVRHDVMMRKRPFELAANPHVFGKKKMSNAITNDSRGYVNKAGSRKRKGKLEDDEDSDGVEDEESEAEGARLVKRGGRCKKQSSSVTDEGTPVYHAFTLTSSCSRRRGDGQA